MKAVRYSQFGAGPVRPAAVFEDLTTVWATLVPKENKEVGYGRDDAVHDRGRRQVYGWGLRQASNHHVSHVLLQKGDLFGRRQVAVPIGAVTGIVDKVQLNLTKQQVENLPPVNLDHPSG